MLAYNCRELNSFAQNILHRTDLILEQPLRITPRQMRDARTLLGWSRERLAARSETTATFISTYENSGRVMNMTSRERTLDALAAVRAALVESGVRFLVNGNRARARLKKFTT